MKKPFLLIISLLLLLLPPVVAAEAPLPTFPSATVKMIGIIEPRDVEIIIENEAGVELSREDALIDFIFPSMEEWEVSQTLAFSYSSFLSKEKSGQLSFEVGDIRLDDYNVLAVTIELERGNPHTTVQSENTFNTQFQPGRQEKTPIGNLTVRIRKRGADVFSAGMYRGTFSMNFTEGS